MCMYILHYKQCTCAWLIITETGKNCSARNPLIVRAEICGWLTSELAFLWTHSQTLRTVKHAKFQCTDICLIWNTCKRVWECTCIKRVNNMWLVSQNTLYYLLIFNQINVIPIKIFIEWALLCACVLAKALFWQGLWFGQSVTSQKESARTYSQWAGQADKWVNTSVERLSLLSIL